MRLLALVLLCALAGAAAPASATADDDPAALRIVVKRRAGLDAAERAALRAGADVTLDHRLSLDGVEVVRADPGERGAALTALRADPDVMWAEPERSRQAVSATNEPMFADLWGLAAIRAPDAWTITEGAGATVAVVDTGVDATHPDLAGRLLGGHDYVERDDTPQDGSGHGTHVAGIVAAGENGFGVAGVAPEAQLVPLRVLDAAGRGSSADVAQAFDDAGDRGIRVVTASLGSPYAASVERDAIQDHPNTLYVVAAGNGGSDNDGVVRDYPCAYPEANIVCVGASTAADAAASFSNVGAESVDLFAPGEDILSTLPGGGFGRLSGTSMATPHVAGAAALLFAAHPGWSARQVKQALLDGAARLPSLTGRAVTGGRLDTAASLALPAPDTDEAPGAPTGLSATAGDTQVALDWDDNPEGDVVGYRVYAAAGSDAFLQIGAPGASAHLARGLADDMPVRVRVAAVDGAGNVGPFSGVATATPRATPPVVTPAGPAAPPAAPAATTPAPVTRPATPLAPTTAAPTLSALALSGRVRACRRCVSHARLHVELAAAARITVRLEQRTCRRGRCAWTPRGRTTVRLAAGAQRWAAGSRLAGLPLRAGTWRVTLTSAANAVALRFAVHAR